MPRVCTPLGEKSLSISVTLKGMYLFDLDYFYTSFLPPPALDVKLKWHWEFQFSSQHLQKLWIWNSYCLIVLFLHIILSGPTLLPLYGRNSSRQPQKL